MKILLFILLSFTLIKTGHSLELNGIGSYQQLRKEFYIGALYLSQTNDNPASIIASNSSKRMALKVTTKRWSPRRWSLQWQNDIAINNTFDDDPELTKQLMLFTGFLDANLTTGDEIIIDYIATVGTEISINGVSIIKTDSSKLFNNLLNVWIGKLPPSGEFKEHILGKDKASTNELLNQYQLTKYDNSRTNLISSWIQKRNDLILAEKRKKELAKKIVADKKAKAEADKKAKIAADKKAKADAIKKAKEAANKKAEANKKLKTATNKTVISKQKKVASSTSKNANNKTSHEIANENKYYLELYRWEIIREIRNAVEYPEWAKKFGQKGTVTLSFNVNRKAEVKNVKGDNPDISVLLISELHRAILAVVPFILPPDALKGESWEISISYNFDPKSDKQSYLKKPIKPASLANTDKKSSQGQSIAQYTKNIKEIINDKIEYPVWAKKLKQKGIVAFEVVINKDGSIASILDKTLSRYDTLNQEVKDAINASTPLPPMPDHSKAQKIKILIEYNFE